jgi:hypothetical protein
MPDYLDNLKPNTERKFSIHKSVNKISKLFNGDLSYSKQPASQNDTTTGWNIFLITCRQTTT